MKGLGALIAGFGTGMVAGQEMRMKREEADRRKKESEQEAQIREFALDREKRVRAFETDLADTIKNAGGAQPPGESGTPTSPTAPVAPAESPAAAPSAAIPDQGSPGVPAVSAVPSPDQPVVDDAGSFAPTRRPYAGPGTFDQDPNPSPAFKRTPAENGILQAATPAAPAAPAIKAPAGAASNGAPSATQRIGYALFSNPDILSSPQYHQAVAQLAAKHGLGKEALQYLAAAKQASDEGVVKAAKSLLSGDKAGAVRAFNQSGQAQTTEDDVQDLGNGNWKVTTSDGNTRQFNPTQYLKLTLSPKDWMHLDTEERKAKAYADYLKEKNPTAVEIAELRANTSIDLEDRKQEGATQRNQASINARAAATLARGGLTGRNKQQTGAKFDVDKDGNRVILYRDGTMVYPKDGDGNPIKFKAGQDLDQKFMRQVVVAAEGRRIPDVGEDPVARARGLAQQTSGPGGTPATPAPGALPPGIPAGSKQIGTSGGKPVYQTPDGRKLRVTE